MRVSARKTSLAGVRADLGGSRTCPLALGGCLTLRRVYTNETAASIVAAGNGYVDFDLHQREVYGEWGFKWAYDDVLRRFNLTGVGCADPCPGEVCDSGPVSPAPLGPEVADEYDGGVVMGTLVLGVYFYGLAWAGFVVLAVMMFCPCTRRTRS